ncbi:MAG: hypothetical protein RLZZ196_422 [Bacteroidota bacterium]|jgi:hypothetical protein
MKKTILFLLLLVMLTNSYGRKFYFSATGNDSYTTTQAQNQATPWQTLRKLTSLTTGTNGPTVFRAGDTICFKRGDVFYGSSTDNYCSAYFWNDGGTYFTAPSGTPSAPIVITNYGDTSLALPNWLHPRAYYPQSFWPFTREGRGIIEFAGVHDIVIDGIQSNDFRIPEWDKANPGYSGGWIIGEWTRGTATIPRSSYTDTSRRKYMVTRFTVKNCVFNNTIYGIQGLAAIDSKITNNTFTNFKSSADTAGINDIMAGAIEGLAGIRVEISHNYIQGAWAKSGRIGSCMGLGGVAFDVFALYNSKICYNTIVDCNGFMEWGNLDQYDSTGGSAYDTIAFNKIINCEEMTYFHGSAGDVFAGNNHHIAFWNNVFVSNNKDRNIGIGMGKDVFGDGQGFAPGTQQPWWFCRNPYSTWNPPNYPLRPTTTTTAGSNVVTVSNASGIVVGTVAFIENDSLLGRNYQTVTVTAINGTQLTLSVAATQTRSTTNIQYHLPVADQTWSCPTNSSFSNYGGKRITIQYSGDNTRYGSYIDTMFDMRNNIFYWTTGTQGVYDRTRFKRRNNIYCPLGIVRYASSVGGTLQTGERIITSKIFRDTLATYPSNWDLHPVDTSYAYNNGTAISGFTTDFEGHPITTPFIGLYSKLNVVTIDTCTFTYGQWSTCNGSFQTRTYTSTPTNCLGTPPLDSIQRVCTSGVVITNFYYNQSNTNIRIDCNQPGTMVISNVLGNIVRTVSYRANGQWISVRNLPAGVYFASTYGRSITFVR